MAYHVLSCIVRNGEINFYNVYNYVRYMNEYVYYKVKDNGDVLISNKPIGRIINNKFPVLAAEAICHFINIGII